MNPMISVIVPVYNVEKYLSRCIDSVLMQTFTDFELLLVDDGSPDNSGMICDEYALKDVRVKVLHQENKGLSGARNAGIENSVGNYVVFIDSDDYVKDNYLCNLLQILPDDISGMGFAVQGCIKCFENGERIKITTLSPRTYYPEEIEHLFTREKDVWGVFSACAKLFERTFLNKYSIRFDETLHFTEDVPFVLRCMSVCDYMVVGKDHDYCYISYLGTMSQKVYPFAVEYRTFSVCQNEIRDLVKKRSFSTKGENSLFKTIHFIFSTLLKSDYHYLGSVSRKERIANLYCVRKNDMEYLNRYYSPSYLADKLGRYLLMLGFIRCYDIYYKILIKLNFKKIYAPL